MRKKEERQEDVPLIYLEAGDKAEVMTIAGGGGVMARLADMGIVPGTILKVITAAPFLGPIEVEVRGSKLALGRGVAAKIIVKKIK